MQYLLEYKDFINTDSVYNIKSRIDKDVNDKILSRAPLDTTLSPKGIIEDREGNQLNVFTVNGKYVRSRLCVDYTEGGHPYVYSFIPEDEIWIDSTMTENPVELLITLQHEIDEYNAMKYDNTDYEKGHKIASFNEIETRQKLKL